MLCQLCLTREATRHVDIEPPPSGRFEQAHYCLRCYRAKYFPPTRPASVFPRPRLTLKHIMIFVGVWALPNAIAAWILRSGFITGTPAQLRQWTIQTFLGVNLVPAFFVVWIALMTWLSRVMWYRRSGGLVPMPVPSRRMTRKQVVAMVIWMTVMMAWIPAAIFLERWLTPKIWPLQRTNLPLSIVILCGPMLPFTVRGLWKNHVLRERFRQDWRTASIAERVVRTVAIAWLPVFVLTIVMGDASLMRWGFVPWFPIPPVLIFGIVVQLVLIGAVALTVRRR